LEIQKLKENKMFKKSNIIFGLISFMTFLGTIGGQKYRWLRRFVYPAIIVIYALIMVKSIWVITIYCMSGILSTGYGRKDEFDDKPSFLGKIAYKVFPQNIILQDVMIRGIIGLGISISMISIPILKNTWISYFIGLVIIVAIWSLNSWRGYGEIKITIFGKEYSLLNVDLVTYGVTSGALILIVNGYFG
jgi:hypothetical protein